MPFVAVVSSLRPNKRAFLPFLLILIGVALLPTAAWGADSRVATIAPLRVPTPGLIIENVGQFPPGIDFVLWGGTQPLWLAQDAIYTPVGDGMAKISLAAGMGQPVGVGPLTTKVSFLRGDDPAQWRADVPVWGAVRYAIPGTDAGLTVTADGRLTIIGVDAALVGAGSTPKTALATESDLIYATLIRGSQNDEEAALAVDGSGQMVIVGQTDSTDFPVTTGGVGPAYAGGTQDAFVAKLAADGQSLLFATFLGGTNSDLGRGVVVDATGNITVVGDTSSTDFPTTDQVFFPTFNGGASDGFVAGLNPDGTQLRFSTFLGGNSYDFLNTIALAPGGDLILAGRTESVGFFVTEGAYDSDFNGGRDIFVARMMADGSDVIFSTFLGGPGNEEAGGVAVDGLGNIYVGGYTWSSAFPTTPGAWDTSFNGGYTDAFVAKLTADGESLAYATFLGGAAGEAVRGVAVDGGGHAVVTGFTASADFPTTPGAYAGPGGGDDLFVVKLLPDGSGVSFASRFGGNGVDYGRGVGINSSGEIVVVGETQSDNFPITPGAVEMTYGGKQDLFVVKLTGDGAHLLYGSYLGGSDNETGHGLAIDSAGHVYVAGSTQSSDLAPGTVIGPAPAGETAIFSTFAIKLTTPTRSITRSYLPFLAR